MDITVTLQGGIATVSPNTFAYTLPAVYGELPSAGWPGWHFAGWSLTHIGFDVPVTPDEQIDETRGSHNLWAVWIEEQSHCIVHFDANGGTPPDESARQYTAPLPAQYGAFPAVTREGYLFDGWWTEPDGGTEVSAEDLVLRPADSTVYAHWQTVPAALDPDGWYSCTADKVAETLPDTLKTAFDAWLTLPRRLARMEVLVAGTVGDYRRAVNAEADAVGSTGDSLIPLACLRHALYAVWYTLAIEMGYADAALFRPGWQDSEVYLRQLRKDLETGSGTAAAAGTPLYQPARNRARPAAVVPVSEGNIGSGNDDDSGINYAPPAPG